MISSKDALTNRASFQYSIAPLDTILLTQNHSGSGLKCEVEVFTDAESNQTMTYRYGKQTIAVKDALNNTTSYNYDAFGNMTAAIDAKGNRTTLEYDIRGNKIKEKTALGFTTEYSYDNNGNLTFEKNGEGAISTSYNRNNQPVSKTYSDNNVKQFQYDGLGRLTWAGDNFSAYRYKYDNVGNLTNRYDEKNGETIGYLYDGNGNRTNMTARDKTIFYKYDALNQVKNETTIAGSVTNLYIVYNYSDMGRISNKQYSTGLKVYFSYDGIYRLTSISNTTNASSGSAQVQFLSSYQYSYDKVGNRTNEAERTIGTNGNTKTRITAFEYDKQYQLIHADYGDGHFERFSYDSCHNRLTKTDEKETVHYTVDNDNRLMLEQDGGKSTRYTYDRAGRLLKKEDGGKVEKYVYNSRNLMTSVTVNENDNTSVSSYAYDCENMRISKTDTSDVPTSVDSPAKRFVYDGQNILFEGATFYLNNIMVSGYEAEIQTLRIALYIKDASGSVRGEVYDKPISMPSKNDPSVSVTITVKTFSYKAFGEPFDPDDAKDGVSFKTHYWDSNTSLYYVVLRYYNPASNRFMTPDKISDPARRYSPAGLNLYVYGLNNPIYWDPDGLWAFGIGLVISWDEQHGWGGGFGVACDFGSGGNPCGINFSYIQYQDSTNVVNLGVAFDAKVASFGFNFNDTWNDQTKTSSTSANVGISVCGVGVEAGGSTYMQDGQIVGMTTHARSIFGKHDYTYRCGLSIRMGRIRRSNGVVRRYSRVWMQYAG